jgi:dTDP-4-dehydrorhamnose reductase
MRIFVVGSEGQVASSLRDCAVERTGLVLYNSSRPQLDLLDLEALETAFSEFRPDVVVNPAAFTAVDLAESEPEQAFAINRDGARNAALAAAKLGVPIIHLSTDYVFDGKKTGSYIEDDAVAPQGVYGRSKLAGELAASESNPHHVILRTAWVYSPYGGNFVRTMLRLSADRDRVRVVDDQLGCPTYAPDIATAILTIAGILVKADEVARYCGVFHLAGPDAMTWYAFARAIFAGVAARGGPAVAVDPIPSSDYPTKALRPSNSQLSSAKLANVFNVRLPPMEDSLARCLDRLMTTRGG